jgi:hypothetical protein
MPTLHLGVNDLPYSRGGKTTGEVADILEARYAIMQTFVDMHALPRNGDVRNRAAV